MHESQESTGLSPEFLSETPLTSPTDHLSYWHDHLKSWEKSGLSQAEYCRRHDLKYCHFWRVLVPGQKNHAGSFSFINISPSPVNNQVGERW